MSVASSPARLRQEKRRLLPPLRAMQDVEPTRAVAASQTKPSSLRYRPHRRQSRRPLSAWTASRAPRRKAPRSVASTSRAVVARRPLCQPHRARASTKKASGKRRGGSPWRPAGRTVGEVAVATSVTRLFAVRTDPVPSGYWHKRAVRLGRGMADSGSGAEAPRPEVQCRSPRLPNPTLCIWCTPS